MEKFCKNCGAHIGEDEMFCPDCGRPTENRPAMKYCPNCGEKLEPDEYFCRNCGVKLKKHVQEKESILDKYKTPIIILAAVCAIALVAFGAYSSLTLSSTQDIEVDSIGFTIPDYFEENERMEINDTDDGIIYKSKFWENGDDYIQIDVMYSMDYVDANQVAGDLGGEKVNMLGYDGYFNELEDSYAFSFVKSNKLVTVYTTSYDLFEEIEAL